MTNLVINVPGEYISLGLVLQSALEQASKGKGKERHASEGETYEDQIICEVARRVGLGYPLGQAVKKIYESQRIGGERGRDELLGAINYIAAAVIVDREMDEHDRALFAKEEARSAELRAEAGKPKSGDELVVLWKHKPEAEGCEALVEHDAPQTKEELFNRIVDCNPSVYPRKPTGEELAELAEEDGNG